MNEIVKIEPEKTLLERSRFREGICKLQEKMLEIPGALIGDAINEVNPLRHSFADGCYIREIITPADEFFISKIHKVAHPFFLLKGELSILSEEGVKRIKAPYYGITPAGTKRIVYTHSEVVWVTVHVTKETDLAKIEEEIIAKNFEEMDAITETNILELKGEISCPG